MQSDSWRIEPHKRLKGIVNIPGDKSISHRSLFFGALAEGRTEVTGFLTGEDCQCTLNALRAMGVNITQAETRIVIDGVGMKGLKCPATVLEMGNSGTSTRLFCGLLAGQSFVSVLNGDKYLNSRPMKRVTAPLMEMGASIYGRDEANLAPLTIVGRQLEGITYHSKIASAQVKSALILAGMQAHGSTVLSEPHKSRDHTERMLNFLGYPLKQLTETKVEIPGPANLTAAPIDVPGDISSAAFFIVAALITPDSEIVLPNVGLNPTRSGILEVLKSMGADISYEDEKEVNLEPRATLVVKSSRLKGTEVSGEIIPRLIDEIPVLAVAAAAAEGTTVIKDAAELRVKESDRIKSVVSQLQLLGVEAIEMPDGMTITGREKFNGGEINSFGDHRIAMAFAAAARNAVSAVEIRDVDCVKTSFPDFYQIFNSL